MAYFRIFGATLPRAARAWILISFIPIWLAAFSQAQVSQMTGSWKVEITFANGESRSLQFDVQSGGRGTFLLLDPRSKAWGPAKPFEAKWTAGKENSVNFSGPIEFPLGNVGRAPGTLDFKGKFESENLIKGELDFSPIAGEQPPRRGTFTAVRAPGE